MRRTVWAFLMVCAASAAQAQMLPETESALRKLGFDPESPKIIAVIYDRVGPVSLATLAVEGDAHAVQAFITTRRFLFNLKVYPRGPHHAPDPALFDPDKYMTRAERNIALQIFFNGFVD